MYDCAGPGRNEALFKFTRLLMESEVPTIPAIHQITKQSGDLIHLTGLHKKPGGGNYDKARELRMFWTRLWLEDRFIYTVPHLRDYIATVCEAHRDKRGHPNKPFGLFLEDFIKGTGRSDLSNTPWRTPEWYEARYPIKLSVEPLTEFYPYITKQPTEEHNFLLAVDALVPKYLPNHTRADVCQDMIVAVLSGEVTLENLKDGLPKYLKQFMKGAPSKYGHLSLDHPASYGDERTLGQVLGL
jgi:hypothetical protein